MQTIIELNNVTAGYGGRAQIHNVSLTVTDRDFIVVTGPNGSGKTTLMRVLLGLIEPMSGTVTFGPAGTRGGTRPAFGYLPQYSATDRDFPIDVRAAVLSGLNAAKGLFGRYNAADRAAADRAMERTQTAALARRHIGELSGGQMQRVLLARAIVSRPDVLILDEPTTYIDRQSWRQLHTIVSDLQRTCAVVMVSHDSEFVSLFAPTKFVRMERAGD